MYFQNLESMKHLTGIKFQSKTIEEFDYWLATRRESTKKYLTPNSFSRYSGLDSSRALELFLISTHQRFNLLKLRYDVFILNKNFYVGSFFDADEIPEKYTDPDTEVEITINHNEDIRAYFELIDEPSSEPESFLDNEGKQNGVGYSEIKEAEVKIAIAISDFL